MLIMIDMFGLFLRLMAFVLLMKINKGLLLLKKQNKFKKVWIYTKAIHGVLTID